MPKTLIKPGYNPKNKTKSNTEKLKVDLSSTLLSNIQNYKQNFLSGKGFIISM